MTPTLDSGARPTPALVFDTLMAHQRYLGAVRRHRTRSVSARSEKVRPKAAKLARRCAASERGIRILCDYLTIQGLVAKEGDVYRHTPTSAAFLDPRSPACVASIARFLGQPGDARALRAPGRHRPHRTHGAGRRGHGRTGESGLGGVRAQHGADDGAVRRAARRVSCWTASPARSACSTSPPAMACSASRWPSSTRGAGIVARGLGGGARSGQSQRRARPACGTVTRLCPAAPSTSITAARTTSFCSPTSCTTSTAPTCVGLLRKVHAALKPGGRAAALEFVPNEDRVTPPMAAGFASPCSPPLRPATLTRSALTKACTAKPVSSASPPNPCRGARTPW